MSETKRIFAELDAKCREIMGGAFTEELIAAAREEGWREALSEAQALIDEQAEDEGLWFMAVTASEAYLQEALRRLHTVIESRTLGKEGLPHAMPDKS